MSGMAEKFPTGTEGAWTCTAQQEEYGLEGMLIIAGPAETPETALQHAQKCQKDCKERYGECEGVNGECEVAEVIRKLEEHLSLQPSST